MVYCYGLQVRECVEAGTAATVRSVAESLTLSAAAACSIPPAIADTTSLVSGPAVQCRGGTATRHLAESAVCIARPISSLAGPLLPGASRQSACQVQ